MDPLAKEAHHAAQSLCSAPPRDVTEAARAIEKNNIGAIVVRDAGRVVGILTDRDLAVRALAAGLDPADTPLSDVMTSPVATLSPSDSQTDAIALMQKWNVRRIPLVEGERLVGIVTLDDLLLDEAAPIEQLGAIVQSQIGEGGPFDERSPQRLRSLARAEATLKRMLAKVRAAAGFDSDEIAEAALETVLTMLVRRLTPDEAKDLVAQLPSLAAPDAASTSVGAGQGDQPASDRGKPRSPSRHRLGPRSRCARRRRLGNRGERDGRTDERRPQAASAGAARRVHRPAGVRPSRRPQLTRARAAARRCRDRSCAGPRPTDPSRRRT